MNVTDLIALTALAASFMSIWAQNRSTQQQLLVANISEYTKRYQEIFEKLPSSMLKEDFNLESFSEKEKEVILRYTWLYFDLCYEEYIVYNDLHLVDKRVWKLWEAGIVSAMSRSSFCQCWAVISKKSFYPEKFTKFMMQIIRVGSTRN